MLHLVMYDATVTLDGLDISLPAKVDPQGWNGYAAPFFAKSAGLRLIDSFNTLMRGEGVMAYDEDLDAFTILWVEGSPEVIRATTALVNGKLEVLYGIGAYGWSWMTELPGSK